MQSLAIFRRAGRYYKNHLPSTIGGSLAVMASALIALLAPGVVRRAIDALSAGQPISVIVKLSGLLVVIAVFSGFFLFLQRQLLVGVSRHIEHHLRVEIFEHMLRLPPIYYMRERVGDIITRAVSDVGAVRMAVGPALMYSINTLTVLIMCTYLMIRISLGLALVALAMLPIVALAARFFGTHIHGRWSQAQERLSHYTSRLQEHLVGLRVLRAYNCEATEQEEMSIRNREYVAASAKLIRISALFQPVLQALIGISFVAILAVGGTAVRAGSITLGQFVEFNLYLVRMIWPMIAVGWVSSLVQRGSASMTRIEALFSEQPLNESIDSSTSFSDSHEPVTIELRNASFSFSTDAPPAIQSVSLVAQAGQRIALVGGVGAGKSTLLNIIPRLLEPTRGMVFLDGQDVLDLPINQLRRAVALVPQGGFLFSATMRENIAFAAPDASEAEIVAAAEAAGLAPDLERWADGLDTVVGERGVTLSGGQRQRASIARALLTKPRILLLDDCLSAVDTQTERQILAALPHTTILFSTHRLAAAELCDHVIVLEQGRVLESGSPEELAALGGRYAHLLTLQRIEGNNHQATRT